ncbi:MAG: lipopolysaccharide heptosyltransferase I [Candidatus Nitricoxidivorans perseverans]|uniref:Lipopolysaccharide heptosyltransferase 1 n=1 Tax=Candidatus Nitricoxidivorans perseverans TaxID=2975601 RepID=A0AA49IVB4_9PROT|nr:MAG: lipopolysaccharide heptosyltransferase I [Candidatus Nitricoxidivorans perseverans]
MRILLVKTSSLGDVIHNLPVASDLARRFPGAAIDWVVEEGFIDIPRMHPAVRHVIPVALRRWRRRLLSPQTWREMAMFLRVLKARGYDAVLDTQGLLKSALIASRALGERLGYSADSAREPAAARFYDRTFPVPKSLHAVSRNRRLAAAALGYSLEGLPLDYGIAVPAGPAFGWLPVCEYAVLLTATSRADKEWPEPDWQALGTALIAMGLRCVLPGGNQPERERAARLATSLGRAMAAPAMSLAELSGLLAGARVVIGVDTGLVHLAAALGRPTVALYCASDPALTGVHAGDRAINLGGPGAPPSAAAVVAAARGLL